jgi:hypothetical protein
MNKIKLVIGVILMGIMLNISVIDASVKQSIAPQENNGSKKLSFVYKKGDGSGISSTSQIHPEKRTFFQELTNTFKNDKKPSKTLLDNANKEVGDKKQELNKRAQNDDEIPMAKNNIDTLIDWHGLIDNKNALEKADHVDELKAIKKSMENGDIVKVSALHDAYESKLKDFLENKENDAKALGNRYADYGKHLSEYRENFNTFLSKKHQELQAKAPDYEVKYNLDNNQFEYHPKG